jgi:hypothetical protein
MMLKRHEFAGEGALQAEKGMHGNTLNSEITDAKAAQAGRMASRRKTAKQREETATCDQTAATAVSDALTAQ